MIHLSSRLAREAGFSTRTGCLLAAAFILTASNIAMAGTISGSVAAYNAASVVQTSGALNVPAGLVTYHATSTLSTGSSIVVTLPSGFTFGSTPTLTSTGTSTFTLAGGGVAANSATFSVATASAQIGDIISLGTFGVAGATALATITPLASALPVTMQAIGTDLSPLSFPAFASAPGLTLIAVGAIEFTDPVTLGTEFLGTPDTLTAVYAAVAGQAQTTAGDRAPLLNANGTLNTISSADTFNVTFTSDFRGYGQAFGSTTSSCTTPSFSGSVTPNSITIANLPVNREEFICVVGSGQPLASQPNGFTNVVVSPGSSTDFEGASVANSAVTIEFHGEICYGQNGCALDLNVIAPVSLQLNSLSSLSLTVVPNESLLAMGFVPVVSNQSATWTATTTTPWLSLSQSSGFFPGMPEVMANASGLAAGTYTGSITVTASAAGVTQTINSPVTLTVTAPAALTASPAAISLYSGYPAVSATGFTLQTGAAGVAFTASTSAASAGWLTISPTSGVAPTPVTVTIDPTKATPGTYTDSIVFTSPGTAAVNVPVQMSLSYAMLPQQVNAATGSGPDHTVAPNEIVLLSLSDFVCPTAPAISINGTAVSYSAYAAGQIKYTVPANITQPAFLTALCGTSTTWSSYSMNTATAIPGIFTTAGSSGQASANNSDGTLNTSANMATRGGWLSVYGTGFGAYNAPGSNGLKTAAGTVTATIGGMASTVMYAGSVPGSNDGLQQFNLQIPLGIAAGSAVPVVLTVNGASTQTTATVAVN